MDYRLRKSGTRLSPSCRTCGRRFRDARGERLAVELYARGLSTRDIEDAFTDETGQRLLSRAAVSEITEKLWAEYEDFCKRDLSEHAVTYLFIDGIAERLRPGQRREAVLAAWGIGEDGRKSLLGLMADRRRMPKRCGRSSRTCAPEGWAIRCSWSATGRLGSSGRSRNAFRDRRVSAVWRTGCAILRPRSRRIHGPSPGRRAATRASHDPRSDPAPKSSPTPAVT